jgi:hypothetical protein
MALSERETKEREREEKERDREKEKSVVVSTLECRSIENTIGRGHEDSDRQEDQGG